VSTVSQVKTALAAKLATISGLRTYDRQPEVINPPFAWPSLTNIEYHGAMGGGLITQTYTIGVIVGRASERSSETLLNTYLSYGSGGVRYALENDPTLGGTVEALIVESAGAISSIDGGDTTYLSVEFRVQVYV